MLGLDRRDQKVVRREQLPAALHAARQDVDLEPGQHRPHVERLREGGPHAAFGRGQVKLAQDDGRWARAYGGFTKDQFPADLLAAIEAEPKALELFEKLTAQNRYALGFRTHNMKTEAGRKKKIAEFVDMLKRGETIWPNGKAK